MHLPWNRKTPQELAKEAKRETKRNVRVSKRTGPRRTRYVHFPPRGCLSHFGCRRANISSPAHHHPPPRTVPLQGAQRDMDREMRELDRTEKQVMAEIKQRAKAPGVSGQGDAALKSLAKQLVQIRKQREKLISAKAQMGAVGMQATAMAAQMTAATAVGSVTTAMKTANQAVDAKEMTKIMHEFQRQNEMAGMKEEMMDDALADAFDTDAIDEEADKITGQVLAELGVELDSQMVGLSAPSVKPKGEEEAEALSAEEQAALEGAIPDLKARLDAL